jgi:hypothetical protein
MLTIEQEKRIREGVRYCRENGASFAYAFWIGGEDDNITQFAYIVGKRKLKLYLAGKSNGKCPSAQSRKETGILLVETTAANGEAYSLLAEALEGAHDSYMVEGYSDHWGHNHKWVSRTVK